MNVGVMGISLDLYSSAASGPRRSTPRPAVWPGRRN
ncbi:hypothetical protein P3T26_002039 [Streptomyces sp. MAA16]|nr:hypothetical protein [Streptomyces sp. MAA16]